MMGLLSADQILKCADIITEQVNVPEWGGDVLVSTVSGAARDAFEMKVAQTRNGAAISNVRALWVAMTLVDKDGRLLFTPDQVEALGDKSSTALGRVFDVSARLNGLTEDDVEEIEKN